MYHNNSLQSPEIVSGLQQTPNLTRNSTDWSKFAIKSTGPKFNQKFNQSKFDQTAQEEHRVVTKAKSGAAHEPKSPQVSWCKNSITIDGKTHPLPTTKEYILHEYADVFKGIGTLPGGLYHIKLKGSYKPVQHLLRSVPLGMQSAYRSELDRLVKEGIIMEVHEHTEWINSIVPVMKEDESLRLCLDPKRLKQSN